MKRLEKIIKLLEGMATLPDWSKLQSDFEAQQSKWQENLEYASEELKRVTKLQLKSVIRAVRTMKSVKQLDLQKKKKLMIVWIVVVPFFSL